jgi:hypothetical protein
MIKQLTAEQRIAIEQAVEQLKPDDGDQVIAAAVADYLLRERARRYHLSVIHDVSPSVPRSFREQFGQPDYLVDPVGRCPLAHDWHYKNKFGITTDDLDRARRWIIDAMLAGYSVFRGSQRHGGGWGYGSIAKVRERQRMEGVDTDRN